MTFSVVVTSLTQLSYQWYFGSSPISGATGGSLTLNPVSSGNAGSYYVTVINAGGSANSGAAILTVLDNVPVANNDSYSLVQNISKTVPAPGVLANDTDANGDPLTAVLVTNVSHGTLNLNANGGFTYLPATNYYGTDSFSYQDNDGYTNSRVATVTLTIRVPPSITTQPQSQIVPQNTDATFSVAASGGAPLHYQWFFKGNTVSQATNSTLTVVKAQNKDTGAYFVVVTNVAASVTSIVATLSIGSLPSVSTLGVSNVATTSATLNGAVNPQGLAANYYFMYGLTTNYGSATVTNLLAAVNGGVSVAVPVSGLTPGTMYHYCAVASNAIGTAYGQDATFTTSFFPPTVLTAGASSLTVTSALLNASVNPQGAATSCYFQYGVTTNYNSATPTNSLAPGSNIVAVAVTANSLAPGTVYHYSVVAINAGGASVGADATFTTAYLPPAVTTLAASNVLTKSAILKATVNPQGLVTGYFFQYGTNTDYGSVTATNMLAAGTNTLNVAITKSSLTPGTVYHFCVVAISAAGTSVGADSTFMTAYLMPKAATLSALNVSMTSAALKGKVNPQGTAASYYFQFGLTTNYDSFTATNPLAAGTNYVFVTNAITGLAPGTDYHYSVVAINAGGISNGVDMTVTTAYPPPTVTTLDSSAVTAGTATLYAAINPLGTDATYYFQYGTDTNYGSWSDTGDAGTDTVAQTVSMSISGLASDTEYYYSAVAVSSGGTTLATNYGTFTTMSVPPLQVSGTVMNLGTNGNCMQLNLTTVPGATLTVLYSTDLTVPLTDWPALGTMTETSPGQYQYTDPATNPCCFYNIQPN